MVPGMMSPLGAGGVNGQASVARAEIGANAILGGIDRGEEKASNEPPWKT